MGEEEGERVQDDMIYEKREGEVEESAEKTE